MIILGFLIYHEKNTLLLSLDHILQGGSNPENAKEKQTKKFTYAKFQKKKFVQTF